LYPERGRLVNADLQGILALSRIDQEIFFLRKKQREYPGKIEQLKKDLTVDKHGTSQLLSRSETLASEKSRLEVELAEQRDGLKKSEDKLMQIKTNEEYDAVHSELSTRKTKISEIENRILSITSDIESVSGKISEAKSSETDDEHVHIREELAQLETENSGLEDEIHARESKREEIVKTIGQKVLSVYSRMYNSRKTGMHVGVATDSRPSCSVCGATLTSQRFIEVKRNDKIVICETCGAILVWEQEAETVSDAEAPVKKKRTRKVVVVADDSADAEKELDENALEIVETENDETEEE
jgi:predicted  nucleic acid-binding Zn-ribbon protein